jgi:hypothetical protein
MMENVYTKMKSYLSLCALSSVKNAFFAFDSQGEKASKVENLKNFTAHSKFLPANRGEIYARGEGMEKYF